MFYRKYQDRDRDCWKVYRGEEKGKCHEWLADVETERLADLLIGALVRQSRREPKVDMKFVYKCLAQIRHYAGGNEQAPISNCVAYLRTTRRVRADVTDDDTLLNEDLCILIAELFGLVND